MNIPSGIVTFLFTDIEGSTRLAQEFHDSYVDILTKHDNILKEAIELNNGFIFKKVGDAFCSSFENASDAVNAAVEIQRRLSENHSKEFDVKVRIGIHTGNAEYVNEDYAGYVTLSRVHRIMSVAHGGQVIITAEVYDSVKELQEGKISFRDFGKRKLKDIVIPEHIYQIVSQEIHSDFPPLKSLDARLNNLPIQLSNFIGREKEIEDIRKLFSGTRLLTLIGFGGTGKTRLSIHIASNLIDEFANGVWFVELAQLSEPTYILQEIASVLSIANDKKRDLFDVVTDFLRAKEVLLILDNCEHLILECARIVEGLLEQCPKLKIVITSRESLRIFGETIYQVPALSLPDIKKDITVDSLTRNESAKLFTDRAIAVRNDFKITDVNARSVAELCFQLDGIPLAIELAAARVKVLPVEKILERLSDRFKLLTGGKRNQLPRQQTLRALIDWSYDLLSEQEKLLCMRLSVFTGGWTLEAAEKVCPDDELDESDILDLLGSLTDKSLVKVFESDQNLRHSMLETIKQYGNEKLTESGKKNSIQLNKFNFFYQLAEDSESGLTGTEQREWIKRITSEYDNIRDCLKWSQENDPVCFLKMCVALGKFWELRSNFTEGLEYFQKSLERNENAEPLFKAKAIYWTGFFLINQGKYMEAKKYLNQCLEMFRLLGYQNGVAISLLSLGTLSVFESDYKNLKEVSDESLKVSYLLNNRSYIARNLQNIGLGLMQQSKHNEAREKLEECLSIYREINDSVQLAKAIGNIGALEYLSGNYEKAIAAFEESLRIRNELGDRQGIGIALNNLGSVAYMQKDFERSEQFLEESVEIMKELGDRRVYVTPVNTLGSIANDRGDFPRAIRMFTESMLVSNEIGDKYTMAKSLEGFADIFMKHKMYKEGCMMAAKYILLLESSNKNLIEAELLRISEIKERLKANLSEADYEKYLKAGEEMTIEESVEYASAIN